MKLNEIEHIKACLPQGKTLFSYFQGRYAHLLLSWLFTSGTAIQEVRQSPYSGLLQKPCVKNTLASTGQSALWLDSIAHAWHEPHEQFLLTLGQWGGESQLWQQTSRRGHNLVLQLNLHDGYRRKIEALLPAQLQFYFDGFGHPVLERGQREFFRQTLGWVRLDIDFNTGEALIEEIQSDWIRDAESLCREIQQRQEHNHLLNALGYMHQRLNNIWDEAILCAALWFLKEELGITTIWYHTFNTGNKLKRIKRSLPPRSLYSKLPRRFCFAETASHPEFMLQDNSFRRAIKRIDSPRWFQLQL